MPNDTGIAMVVIGAYIGFVGYVQRQINKLKSDDTLTAIKLEHVSTKVEEMHGWMKDMRDDIKELRK